MKKINQFVRFVLVFTLLSLLISGCSQKDPLVGTWVEPNSGIYMTFGKDGKVMIGASTTSYTMEYEEQTPNILVIKVSTTGSVPDLTMNYSIDKENDKLTLTVNGVDTIFVRKGK